MSLSPQSQIDYTSFPHIIDSVLSFAAPEVLRTFRLTCCHYDELITSWHLKHLTLRMDGRLASSHGDIVIYRRADLLSTDPEPTGTAKHRLASLLRKTKTLTMYLPPSNWLVSLLPFLDAVYNFGYWETATIPASRIAVWRTMNFSGLHFIQPGIQSIVIDDCYVPEIHAKDEDTSPLEVPEIVQFFRSEVDQDFETCVAGTCFGKLLQRRPSLVCSRFIIVNAPDETAFMDAVRGPGSPDNYFNPPEDIEWQFLTNEEYMQALSPEDKVLIPL